MAVDALVERDQIVCDLRDALRDTTSGLAYAPRLIHKVLATDAWRERYDRATHQAVPFSTFREFVETDPTEGLGATVDLVERMVGDDPETVRLLRRALKGTNNVSTKSRTTRHGQRRDYALERLEHDAPTLHADVLAGRLSAHGAMVKAGFRPKTVSVPVDRAESIARTLRKQVDPEVLHEVIRLLTEDG